MREFLGYELYDSPDVIDRIYAVDQLIIVNGYLIGFQIKPQSFNAPCAYGAKRFVNSGNEKFTREYGGKVFILIKDDKGIRNKTILEEVKIEINKLLKLPIGKIKSFEDIIRK
jgi:hypothetical protein